MIVFLFIVKIYQTVWKNPPGSSMTHAVWKTLTISLCALINSICYLRIRASVILSGRDIDGLTGACISTDIGPCTTTNRRTMTSWSWRRATRCTWWRSATTDGTSVPARGPVTSAPSRATTWRDCEEGRRSRIWTPRGASGPRIAFTKALGGIVRIDTEFLNV